MVTARAFITLVNAISQMVQVFGFIRLGRMPNMRKGTENGPRNGTGRCNCCQQPMQMVAGSGVTVQPSRWPRQGYSRSHDADTNQWRYDIDGQLIPAG
jgi:hypothetical protein